MRSIKFRGKRIDNGEWLFGSLVITKFKGNDNGRERYFITQFLGNYSFDHEVVAETVGQYADFFDDNDSEVCEGDIVEVEYGKGKVVFKASCFMIEWIDDPEANMELLSMTPRHRARETLKIIGNIHDNQLIINKPNTNDKGRNNKRDN